MDCSCQAPLSIGFSMQEYSCGSPCPPPGDLFEPGQLYSNNKIKIKQIQKKKKTKPSFVPIFLSHLPDFLCPSAPRPRQRRHFCWLPCKRVMDSTGQPLSAHFSAPHKIRRPERSKVSCPSPIALYCSKQRAWEEGEFIRQESHAGRPTP